MQDPSIEITTVTGMRRAPMAERWRSLDNDLEMMDSIIGKKMCNYNVKIQMLELSTKLEMKCRSNQI